MSGTDIAYGPTVFLGSDWVATLLLSYALATRCPVLTEAPLLLPDARYRSNISAVQRFRGGRISGTTTSIAKTDPKTASGSCLVQSVPVLA
eukprot:265045-Rhodomonas_salina.1